MDPPSIGYALLGKFDLPVVVGGSIIYRLNIEASTCPLRCFSFLGFCRDFMLSLAVSIVRSFSSFVLFGLVFGEGGNWLDLSLLCHNWWA